MILTATRGQDFTEPFTFKNERGQTITPPNGAYSVVLERSNFVKQYSGLLVQRNGVLWTLTAKEVGNLPYSKLTFTLFYNGGEIARGVLRVL